MLLLLHETFQYSCCGLMMVTSLDSSHVFGVFSDVLSSWVKNENISKLFIL